MIATGGPGVTSAEPAIPLAYPIAAAATEDYILINDWVNARLVRVQLTQSRVRLAVGLEIREVQVVIALAKQDVENRLDRHQPIDDVQRGVNGLAVADGPEQQLR